MVILCTFELDMAEAVVVSDIDIFLLNMAWAIWSTSHILLTASLSTAIFGQDVLFGIFLLTGMKFENTGATKQFSIPFTRIKSGWIGIIQLVTKHCYGKTVSSTIRKRA